MLEYESALKGLTENGLPKFWLQCIGHNDGSCNKRYKNTEIRNECECGGLLEVMIDYQPHKEISPEVWRDILIGRAEKTYMEDARHIGMYQEFLPIENLNDIVTAHEGMTPVVYAPRTAEKLGLKSLLKAKLLGQNFTGSFKDYGVPMVITEANRQYRIGNLKSKKVVASSTGNTSSSVSAFAKIAGFEPYILFGSNVSSSKLVQTVMNGGNLVEVKGAFDDAMRVADELSKDGKFYLCNSKNPFRIEGQKTIAFETMLQMNFGDNIDAIVLPVGNAGNITAIYKGFKEWKELGITKRIPRLFGVQAEGANPLAIECETGEYVVIKDPHTDASAIKIGNPVSRKKAMHAVKATGGAIISVPDKKIFEWQRYLSSKDGIGCEPASAASVAGLEPFMDYGHIDPDEKVLCMLTGILLKDTNSPQKEEYNPGLLNRPKVAADKNAILKALKIIA